MVGEVSRNPDLEILQAILNELDAYRSRLIHLPRLVNALDLGIASLVTREATFIQNLRENWRVIAEVNALALDQQDLYPLDEDTEMAEAAILKIEDAVKIQLAP